MTQHREPRDVTSQVVQLWPRLLSQQMTAGIREYGTTLKTWNQRDAARDALEELTDAYCYVVQLQLERDDLLRENECLRAALAGLGLTVDPDGAVMRIDDDG